ncbi:MAG: alpha/beta hydrolase [Synergistaceae bacterium]|jgi:pimeloyl-ACP methyl ester carboxylesterase|nr:alpha/beta hydrolase [Synergistaceae bacterium]
MKIRANGVELHYEKSGGGRPLFLLHGNGEDHRIFDSIAPLLSRDFAVYAIDSRNHGESSKTEVYDYDVMAEDITAFARELKLKKINAVGFSDGAIIALIMAMKSGGIIERMALLGVNLKPGDLTEEAYGYIKGTYERTKDPLFKLMLEQPNIEIGDITGVEVPTLVVASDDDICGPEFYAGISKALPNAEMKIMKGFGHDGYIAGSDILYPDLIRFFS